MTAFERSSGKMKTLSIILDTGCFKKSFTMEFLMLLHGECYEDVYT
jgi:hypothetical protein